MGHCGNSVNGKAPQGIKKPLKKYKKKKIYTSVCV